MLLPENKHVKTLTNIQNFGQHSASDGPLMTFPFDSLDNMQKV
jgi:hypothetical protein